MTLMSFSCRILSFLLFLSLFSCDFKIDEEKSIQELVPQTAVFGQYTKDVGQTRLLLQHPGLASVLADLNASSLKVFEDNISWFSTIPSEVVLSWHSIGKESLESLVLAKFNENFEQLSQYLPSQKMLASNYNGFEIFSFKIDTADIFYCLENDIIAISQSKILIEDFIRSLEDESASLKSINKGKGRSFVFLNNERLNEVGVNISAADEGVALMNYTLNSDQFSFNGNIDWQVSQTNFQLFGASYIPNEFESIDWLTNSEVHESLGQPYLKVGLEVFGQLEYLILAQSSQTDKLKTELRQTASSLLSSSDSLPYMESYANEEIRFIDNDYFSKIYTKENQLLEEGTYYAIVQDLVLVSSSAEAIRQSLSSHADELTMGQSVQERGFYEQLVQDTYYTSIYAYNGWKSKTGGLLSRLVYQANSFSNGLLISGQMDFEEDKRLANESSKPGAKLLANTFLDADAISKATVMTNHIDQSKELIIQDDLNQVYQISKEGGVNWKRTISGVLAAPVVQVDYYDNRKLQYLLLTDSLIHLIDRNGKEVEGFPQAHGITEEINGLRVIDYDNTKRYRFLIEAGRGKVYLLNKNIEPLEGWSPRNLDAVLPNSPEHARIAGKDFFWVAERSNRLLMLNRRGEYYPGFPFEKNFRFSGDTYLSRRPSFRESYFVALSHKGLLIEVNLLGELQREEQLFRTNESTLFQLVNDRLGKGYLILRNEEDHTVFLNEDYEELFQMEEAIGAEVEVSFYRFKGGAETVMIWDKLEESVRLYNLRGQLIGQLTSSSFSPSLMYYRNQGVYQLFVNFGTEVNVYQFSSLPQ